MRELIRTTDRIFLSALRACLSEHGVDALWFDENANALWSAALPVRVVVRDQDFWRAERALAALRLATEG